MLKVLFSEPTATFLVRYEGLIDERMHKNHVIDQHVSPRGSDSYCKMRCPCLLPGQLATDVNWIGKRIGMLKHALQRCVTAADLIGGRALIVNAIDVEAATFWRRRGFIPSKDDPARPVQVDLRHCSITSRSYLIGPRQPEVWHVTKRRSRRLR
jgi:hypothetical protein